jgi:hypothetical protein
MPLARPVLERQLKLAEQTLALRAQVLKQGGKEAAAFATDPQWRSASAACTTVRRRLNAVAKVEANNAEVERLKAAREAGDDATEE